ncbi:MULTISPECIES: alcohol acetyltransferase [unclassified Brachybacterium]|uniref:alcohol acetyltransferase n=1 Tax=unclassified Brachybacterium TaxID=2623841 RepID=UPI003615BEAE
MSRKAWVRLDNASNIFLAARSEIDPKVFRMSAELDHDVDPQLLQDALDLTYDRYRLYHAVLRRGVFWYYLQDSDLRPVVSADDQPTCAPIYQADRRTLLFRVVHHHRRIVLEVFHALSDGTGALWFLSDLVAAYVRLRHRAQERSADEAAAAGGDSVTGEPAEGGRSPAPAQAAAVGRGVPEPAQELTTDSFAHYFRRRRRHHGSRGESPVSGTGSASSSRSDAGSGSPPGSRSAFSRAAAPAALTVADMARRAPRAAWERGRAREPRKRIHRVRGTRTPDNRTRAVELTMPATQVLELARAENVSLTVYLTAVFFESVRRASGGLGRARTLAASVPVNLRQFFPSTSARNFFATIRVEHTYGEGADDLGAICRQLEGQFAAQATPEALEEKLRGFIRFERTPALRAVPRPLKDAILRAVNWGSNRGLTVAVSNLGRVSLPEPAESEVRRMLFHVSAVRPQFCAMSHAGLLTLSFTSPFVETGHIREFARLLTSAGVDVTVAAARVTEGELSEAEQSGADLAEAAS